MKVFIETYGCTFNQADSEIMAGILAKEGIKPDTVIVDPPRKGCDADLIKTIAEDFKPERVVYVSCDPATLARDCGRLFELGYTVQEVTPVDMFARTSHTESVALLMRQ